MNRRAEINKADVAEAGSQLSPRDGEHMWGVPPRAKGLGTLGLSAALWDSAAAAGKTIERSRPAAESTHVVSIWTQGSVVSELYLDGRLRFRRVRRRGTFQLARAGESLRVILSENTGSCLDLYLPSSLLHSVLDSEFESSRISNFELLPLKLESNPAITRLADDISGEMERPVIASKAAFDAATLSLCVNLIRYWSNADGGVRLARAGLTPAQVRKTTDLLNDSVHLDISLEEMSRRIGLSPFHFARSFKKAVGVPPHRYQVQLRMKRARDYLENSDMSVDEIANKVGYEDASYFARIFKKEHTVSPRQFRRSKGD